MALKEITDEQKLYVLGILMFLLLIGIFLGVSKINKLETKNSVLTKAVDSLGQTVCGSNNMNYVRYEDNNLMCSPKPTFGKN